MNCSKIAGELIFQHLSVSKISVKYGVTKTEVVKTLFKFLATFPKSSHNAHIKQRLKVELAKEFLASQSSTLDFAEEYDINPSYFRKLMNEVVDDPKIINSDVLADKLFRKVMDGASIKSRYMPKRIVKYIAQSYVSEERFSQYDLANIYSTQRGTISSILKRAIAENIVDDITAEKIIAKIRGYNKSVDAYNAAFDKRETLNS